MKIQKLQTTVTVNQINSCLGNKMMKGGRQVQMGGLPWDLRTLRGDRYIILIVVMVSWVFTCNKIH